MLQSGLKKACLLHVFLHPTIITQSSNNYCLLIPVFRLMFEVFADGLGY